jgi:serine phosphatase RsbU (regulator of sigma subunit)
VAVIVGDVSGNGVEAAHLASFTREAIRAYALHNGSPRHVLRLANEALIHRHGREHFVTVAFVLLDPTTGRLKYSLAGHPPPVSVSPSGIGLASWKAYPPLGVFEDARFLTARCTLGRGDILVFYTDGITEARRNDQFLGEEGLIALLTELRSESPEVIVERVLARVTSYAKGSLRDDAAVLALTRA